MRYIDVIIPLGLGILIIFNVEAFVKPADPSYEKKKSTIKKAGYLIIVAAVIYAIGKIAS
jgi:hypothetical protein